MSWLTLFTTEQVGDVMNATIALCSLFALFILWGFVIWQIPQGRVTPLSRGCQVYIITNAYEKPLTWLLLWCIVCPMNKDIYDILHEWGIVVPTEDELWEAIAEADGWKRDYYADGDLTEWL